MATGDRLLLCTDGLHQYLDAGNALSRLFQLDVREAAVAAIAHAHRCGAKDHITVVFVEVVGDL